MADSSRYRRAAKGLWIPNNLSEQTRFQAILNEAADEIEQLQARVAPLEALLEAVENLANTDVDDHNEMDRRTDDLWYYMDRAKQAVPTTPTDNPDGFKCIHCGYIGDVSEPPHVCDEMIKDNGRPAPTPAKSEASASGSVRPPLPEKDAGRTPERREGMNDIVSLDRHPVLMQAYEVCQAIEECGCSEELTAAVTKASGLLDALKPIVVEIEQKQKVVDAAIAFTVEANRETGDDMDYMQAEEDLKEAVGWYIKRRERTKGSESTGLTVNQHGSVIPSSVAVTQKDAG